MASYMERTAETSTGGPPSIVLMISRMTGAGSALYSWRACLKVRRGEITLLNTCTIRTSAGINMDIEIQHEEAGGREGRARVERGTTHFY